MVKVYGISLDTAYQTYQINSLVPDTESRLSGVEDAKQLCGMC